MYPVNQVILGGESMFNSIDDIDAQIQKMELYRQKLKALNNSSQSKCNHPIWNEIDSEIIPMSEEQKARLLKDNNYSIVYNELQSMVQTELLNLVKDKIENTDKGKELLNKQLEIVRKLKTKIIEDTNREMEVFRKFKEYSREHPGSSYDEFIKNSI